MIVKLKFYFSIVFIAVFFFNQLSAVWLSLALQIHKERFQAAAALTLVPFTEDHLHANPSFRWIMPEVEFTIDNKMYDVKSIQTIDGVKKYLCKYDPYELKILKRLKKAFRELNNQSQTGNQKATGFFSITTLFYQELTQLKVLILNTHQKTEFWYQFVVNNFCGVTDTPPPKFLS